MMTDERRMEGIRRDATVAAEMAAVASAALQSMLETGGTAIERAGVLRVTRIARGCSENVVEQVDYAEGRIPSYLRAAG